MKKTISCTTFSILNKIFQSCRHPNVMPALNACLLFTGLFLSAFISNPAYGQVNESERLEFLAGACDLTGATDTISGHRYCLELENMAAGTTDSLIKAEALRIAGNCYGRQNRFDKAYDLLEKAIQTVRNDKSKAGRLILAKSLVNNGAISHQNGDFNTALNDYLEAEKIFYVEKDISWLIRTYASMGDLYDKIAQPGKREEVNEKAYALVSQTGDLEARIKAYTCKANNLSNGNKFAEAIEYYKKTVDLAKQLNNSHLEHVAWYNLGFMYSRMDSFTMATEMYRKSYETAINGGNAADAGDALYKLGLMFFYSGNYNRAREYLSQAMETADRLNSNILKRNIYDVLYSVEEATGDYKKAYEYLNDYVDVEFELFSEQDQIQTNFLKAKFDAEKREFRIQQLENEKQIQELSLKKQQSFLFVLVLLVLLLLSLASFVFRRYKYKQALAKKQSELQKQKIQELEKEKQLVATRSVLEGEEAERTRLAGDLHDGLGGLLSGVKINLSTMKENSVLSERQVQEFNHAISLLDSSITELRRIAHNMVPETLHLYGLVTACSDFCEEISAGGKPFIHFNSFGENRRYAGELELTVYRIGQELVNNALKHADAENINVQLFTEPGRISLQVFDDGKGFDSSRINVNPKGRGLQNIKNRVAAFGGKLDTDSIPGKGTEILLEFTVNSQESS